MKSVNFKKAYLLLIILVATGTNAAAQNLQRTTAEKRENRKDLVVREYNSDAKNKNRRLDHETFYNEKGLKVLEKEYDSTGLKYKVTYEYDAAGRCIKDVYYDSKEKPARIRKYEYNPDGTKKKQYNYQPNGRLTSTKVFEYSRRN